MSTLHRSLLSGLALTCLALGSQADVATTRVADSLVRPIYVTHAPGDSGRIFIVEKRGVIKTLDLASGAVATFMNIDPRVSGGGSNNSEQGLLGLAFHPDYATNGFFYVYYTAIGGDVQISRFSALGAPATATAGDDTSEFPMLSIPQPQGNHNGGWIDFGPNDGYLYIATGDGGNRCDQGTGHTAGTGNAQDITENLLGKILRIDVDSGTPYGIPADNPFVGVVGDDEIWSYGLRNPYRCSFDRLTGDLYIGDVGQDLREEVNFQPASSVGGENWGWRCLEGNACANVGASNCPATTGCNCPSGTPGLDAPVFDYTHNPPLSPAGFVCSVISGYVYRGACLPEIYGTYFFADFCAGGNSAWSFEVSGGSVQNFLFRDEFSPALTGQAVNQITSFGEDADGELYIVDQGNGTNGNIFKVVPLATVASRIEGTNPASFVSSPARLGDTLTATVDNNVAGQTTSLLFAFDTPTSLTLAGGQTLLSIDSGSGEMLTGAGLPPSSSAGGIDTYSSAVPNNPAFCGLAAYAQAIQFGNPPFVLSNSQDLIVGF